MKRQVHSRPRPAPDRGFTLLEMLISAAISLVTLGVLYSTLIAFQKVQFEGVTKQVE